MAYGMLWNSDLVGVNGVRRHIAIYTICPIRGRSPLRGQIVDYNDAMVALVAPLGGVGWDLKVHRPQFQYVSYT